MVSEELEGPLTLPSSFPSVVLAYKFITQVQQRLGHTGTPTSLLYTALWA